MYNAIDEPSNVELLPIHISIAHCGILHKHLIKCSCISSFTAAWALSPYAKPAAACVCFEGAAKSLWEQTALK